MYYPCIECFNRYGRGCTVECIDNCDYMNSIKRKDDRIQALEELVDIKDAELVTKKTEVEKLRGIISKLESDLNYAYQIVCKLKGDHYG